MAHLAGVDVFIESHGHGFTLVDAEGSPSSLGVARYMAPTPLAIPSIPTIDGDLGYAVFAGGHLVALSGFGTLARVYQPCLANSCPSE
jgi:hypothetical protein